MYHDDLPCPKRVDLLSFWLGFGPMFSHDPKRVNLLFPGPSWGKGVIAGPGAWGRFRWPCHLDLASSPGLGP